MVSSLATLHPRQLRRRGKGLVGVVGAGLAPPSCDSSQLYLRFVGAAYMPPAVTRRSEQHEGRKNPAPTKRQMRKAKLKNPERGFRSRGTSDRRKNLRPVWLAEKVRALIKPRSRNVETIRHSPSDSRTPPDKHGQKEVFPKGSVAAVFLLLFLKKK